MLHSYPLVLVKTKVTDWALTTGDWAYESNNAVNPFAILVFEFRLASEHSTFVVSSITDQ